MTDKQDLSKIFIWGQVGDKLKSLDEKRMLAIAQANPDYYMSVLANDDIENVIKEIIDNKGLNKDIEDKIKMTNELDNIFREISAFMQEVEDMLSIGSFMTGELEKKRALLDLYGGNNNG